MPVPKMTLGDAVNQNCMRIVREYIESGARILMYPQTGLCRCARHVLMEMSQ